MYDRRQVPLVARYTVEAIAITKALVRERASRSPDGLFGRMERGLVPRMWHRSTLLIRFCSSMSFRFNFIIEKCPFLQSPVKATSGQTARLSCTMSPFGPAMKHRRQIPPKTYKPTPYNPSPFHLAPHRSPLSIFSSGSVSYSSGTTSSSDLKSLFLIVASHLSCASLHHKKCCKYSSLEYNSIL